MTGLKSLLLTGAFAGAAALLPLAAYADAASETVTAAQHAGYAAAAADIGGVHTHLHHTLNCLVGPAGDGFDKTNLNPCANAGKGAIPDEMDAAMKTSLESAAAKARAAIAETDYAKAKADAAEVQAMLTKK